MHQILWGGTSLVPRPETAVHGVTVLHAHTTPLYTQHEESLHTFSLCTWGEMFVNLFGFFLELVPLLVPLLGHEYLLDAVCGIGSGGLVAY